MWDHVPRATCIGRPTLDYSCIENQSCSNSGHLGSDDVIRNHLVFRLLALVRRKEEFPGVNALRADDELQEGRRAVHMEAHIVYDCGQARIHRKKTDQSFALGISFHICLEQQFYLVRAGPIADVDDRGFKRRGEEDRGSPTSPQGADSRVRGDSPRQRSQEATDGKRRREEEEEEEKEFVHVAGKMPLRMASS